MPSSADPVSAVQQYIDAFNKADVKAMAAMCADPMSILVPRVEFMKETLDWLDRYLGPVQGGAQ